MTPGSQVRLRVSLGAVPTGHVCKVLETYECGGVENASIDIECDLGSWRTRYTVWASELEAISENG